MDGLESRLARIGLKVASAYGFVLGGGHAVQIHGMGARPSEDIDCSVPVAAAQPRPRQISLPPTALMG